MRRATVAVFAILAVAPGCVRPPTGAAAGPAAAAVAPATPLTAESRRWVDRTLASLSLRDRVAQLVMVWVLGDYTSTTDSAFAQARSWVADDHVGGVVMSLGSPIEVAAKINDLQHAARVPLIVASDLEPGLGRLEGGVFAPSAYLGGSATILPSAMAIGATGNPANAETAGRITGEEARAIGIRLVFAPVVDVNNNPANPVINTRSFGEDPEAVARMSAAFVRGLQSTGVAATAKHFPGHGDTDTDSHLALPMIHSDRARLDAVELTPFRAAIGAGIAGVMTAHIALPAISHDSIPATLSPAIMTGLLRDTLGFRGLTVTDALTMQGIGKGYTTAQSAVLALKAGSDILLMPTNTAEAIDAVVAAVERGEVSRARVDSSVRRVLELKARTGVALHPVVALDSLRAVVGSADHRAAALRIARESVTLLRDERSLVPAGDGPPTVIVSYAGDQDVTAGRAFVAALTAALPSARTVRVTSATARPQLDSVARPGERIIVHALVRTIEGEGRFALSTAFAGWLDSVAGTHAVIFAASGNPYLLREVPHVGTYLATFGRGPALEQAAAEAIAGLVPIGGRAPVSLPGYFARGDGLSRPAGLAAPGAAVPVAVQRAGRPVARPAFEPGASARARLADTMRVVLDAAVRDSAFPGAFAVVGNAAGVLAQYGAGHLDWSPSPVPDEHTLWDMASLTKVTALTSAMIQLVAAGRVDLDAPVQRYLPTWTGPNKEKVTVRHLLTHSSGLPAWRPVYKEATDPESAMRLVYATPLDTLPGVRMVYSDLGAILLGEIVRTVTGQRIDAYAAEHVFGPLQMTDTRYLPPASELARIAPTEIDPWRQRHLRGEVHDENAYALGGVSAHAGLFSSGHDMARLARAYLGGGALDGVRVFDEATMRRFTTVQDSAFSNRALGWETPTGDNSAGHLLHRPAFGHTGFTGTSIWIDPAHDLFIVLLTNRVDPTRANLKITRVRQTLADAVVTVLGATP
ncbi:MAG TPA: glycoside hydrolase family 3 N-terminal domain-containing protein [Gemmatimonadaceae bacterium]|nr:glycoside hydrolase family 3 N-terminal domain-containing protein [Gemmatimonadaceae bacterium]